MWQKPVPRRGGEVVSILWMGVRALSQQALRLGLRLKEMVIKRQPRSLTNEGLSHCPLVNAGHPTAP